MLKEFDTYKISTVANSTSTMHKLTSNPITLDCFELGDFNVDNVKDPITKRVPIEDYISFLEQLRRKYL